MGKTSSSPRSCFPKKLHSCLWFLNLLVLLLINQKGLRVKDTSTCLLNFFSSGLRPIFYVGITCSSIIPGSCNVSLLLLGKLKYCPSCCSFTFVRGTLALVACIIPGSCRVLVLSFRPIAIMYHVVGYLLLAI